MADVSHELDALRFVVDSPLSSKVAMFNNQAQQHKQTQLLNPFSSHNDGRCSPKPTFAKGEYGKPLAGSLTEARGQKANMHVMREMVELCQIIDSEGYAVNDEPDMRVIPFGELFNIYNFISDKVVGILLRARKYKYVDFEGEMLFQRRDDDVPVFLLKPIKEIRTELENKIAEIKRGSSPAPQATSVLLDQSAHKQKLEENGLVTPTAEKRKSVSRTPSPNKAKTNPQQTATKVAAAPVINNEIKTATNEAKLTADDSAKTAASSVITPELQITAAEEQIQTTAKAEAVVVPPTETATATSSTDTLPTATTVNVEPQNEVSSNSTATNDLPTIVIEASAVFVKTSAEVPAAEPTVEPSGNDSEVSAAN